MWKLKAPLQHTSSCLLGMSGEEENVRWHLTYTLTRMKEMTSEFSIRIKSNFKIYLYLFTWRDCAHGKNWIIILGVSFLETCYKYYKIWPCFETCKREYTLFKFGFYCIRFILCRIEMGECLSHRPTLSVFRAHVLKLKIFY